MVVVDRENPPRREKEGGNAPVAETVPDHYRATPALRRGTAGYKMIPPITRKVSNWLVNEAYIPLVYSYTDNPARL